MPVYLLQELITLQLPHQLHTQTSSGDGRFKEKKKLVIGASEVIEKRKNNNKMTALVLSTKKANALSLHFAPKSREIYLSVPRSKVAPYQ